jgi:hypothetical protein
VAEHRFDTISRMFASRKLSRRQALATGSTGLAAGVVAVADLAYASGQDASPQATPETGTAEKTMYLFVQSFQNGAIVPIEGRNGRYTVALEQGTGQTIYFGDRPSRAVGVTPTSDFLVGLGFSEENPPNAALIVETETGETDIAVVELFNPHHDPLGMGVTYEVEVLANWQDDLELGLHEEPKDLAALTPVFGAAHLLIDDCNSWPMECCTNVRCTDDGCTCGNYIGSIGPVLFCWKESEGCCKPCSTMDGRTPFTAQTSIRSPDYSYSGVCNQTYSACAGNCMAMPGPTCPH